VYREQNIILSPFEDDGTVHFRARRMFMGAQGVSALGIMERDALIVSSEQRLMRQADELVVLVDSTKFRAQSSMILAPLARATRIITDHGITDEDRRMVEAAGVDLIVAEPLPGRDRAPSTSSVG
jgi:DeoR family ulaG and ulaABCDEF operon transcriptional repressor